VLFFLVWVAVMSAFVISCNSPVVGLECKTLVYLLFGACSSVAWVIQFSKHPKPWVLKVSYVANAAAVVFLLAVVVFQVRHVQPLGFPVFGAL